MRTKVEGLTKKQKEVLNVIKKFYAENKYPPSVRQIGGIIGISSPATIHVHLNGLIDKGFIKRNSYGNKAIELLVPNEYDTKSDEVVNVSLINEGSTNIDEQLEVAKNIFSVPTYLVENNDSIFTVKIESDFLRDIGIYKNDIVIVSRNCDAKDDDLIVCMDVNNKTIVRKYFKNNNSHVLKACDCSTEDIVLDEIIIYGKVIGLYRKY